MVMAVLWIRRFCRFLRYVERHDPSKGHKHTPVSGVHPGVHEHKSREFEIFTDRPGHGETGHAHAPKQHTPTPTDGEFGHPSLQKPKRKNPQIVLKTTFFLVFMNTERISLFALLAGGVRALRSKGWCARARAQTPSTPAAW